MEKEELIDQEETMDAESLKEKYSQEMADYFGVEKDDSIKLITYESMEAMAKDFEDLTGRKAPYYLKGFSPRGSRDKEIWLTKWGTPDEGGRIMARKYFNESMKHELAHAYQKIYYTENKLDFDKIPIWFKEGMALYIAGQRRPDPENITIDILKKLDGLDSAKFRLGYKVVSEIMKNYGKDKLIELFSIQDQDQLYQELQRMFDWLK